MPFELSGATYTLAAAIHFVLNDCRKFAVAYYDDIIVHSKRRQDHLEHLKKNFKVLATSAILINLQKLGFTKTSVEFLDHVIEEGSIKPCIQNIGEIVDFPVPTDKDMLRSFLGVVGFYKKFIPDFAVTAQPLFNLLKKDVDFICGIDCQKGFEYVKKELQNLKSVAQPDF